MKEHKSLESLIAERKKSVKDIAAKLKKSTKKVEKIRESFIRAEDAANKVLKQLELATSQLNDAKAKKAAQQKTAKKSLQKKAKKHVANKKKSKK